MGQPIGNVSSAVMFATLRIYHFTQKCFEHTMYEDSVALAIDTFNWSLSAQKVFYSAKISQF